jgi:colanic acid biosynthesis glycosyl transferase WcaI
MPPLWRLNRLLPEGETRNDGAVLPVSSRYIILLNRFFFPDQSPTSVLLSDLAFALSENGFNVTVITSRLRYDDRAAKLSPSETIRGVEIRRVWSFRSGHDHLAERATEYLSFYVNAAWCLWRLARAGTVIVAKTDPPLLSIPAAVIARIRGARLVNWLQDLFPEVAEKLVASRSLARSTLRLLLRPRNWSLSGAAVNVVPGTQMAKTLEREGIDANLVEIVPNWSDGTLIEPIAPEVNELRKRWGLDSSFVVGYAGNFGRAHDFETILQAMKEQKNCIKVAPPDDPLHRIVFLFVGGGPQRTRLQSEIAAHQLRNVKLLPYQPTRLLGQALSAADVHFVSLKPELEGLMVPSKFYGIAAAARPTIFIGSRHGEIANLIEETKCGITVEPGDGRGLLTEIIRLANDPPAMLAMGARARFAFENKWDKRHGLAKWQEIIDRAAKSEW